jgi:hypothetical protein
LVPLPCISYYNIAQGGYIGNSCYDFIQSRSRVTESDY